MDDGLVVVSYQLANGMAIHNMMLRRPVRNVRRDSNNGRTLYPV